MTIRIEKKMEKDVEIFNLPYCNKNGLVHMRVYCTSRKSAKNMKRLSPIL
jgi:hypothetical protein